ncbi:MAG: flagellar motor protein MotD [Pseudomonadota bacterium]
MARKKYEEDPENSERWLISYADFITLLFAFFVVMYAISSVNEGKYRVLSNALGNAFRNDGGVSHSTIEAPPLQSPGMLQLPSPKQRSVDARLRREREQMTRMARDLKSVLAPLVREGKVRVTQSSRGISVEINASVLFAPGEAKLADQSDQALRAVAVVLKDDLHAIQVEGHTDNVPIKNVFFPSNWDLSAVRASSVIRLFADSGIQEGRLTAIGHGSNQPVAPNETPEGRARNRRVAVTILAGLPDVVTEIPTDTVAGTTSAVK